MQTEQIRLTKGQRDFFRTVASGKRGVFHRRVIEPVEELGLVQYGSYFRLAGCNAFDASMFMLTERGLELAERVSA